MYVIDNQGRNIGRYNFTPSDSSHSIYCNVIFFLFFFFFQFSITLYFLRSQILDLFILRYWKLQKERALQIAFGRMSREKLAANFGSSTISRKSLFTAFCFDLRLNESSQLCIISSIEKSISIWSTWYIWLQTCSRQYVSWGVHCMFSRLRERQWYLSCDGRLANQSSKGKRSKRFCLIGLMLRMLRQAFVGEFWGWRTKQGLEPQSWKHLEEATKAW